MLFRPSRALSDSGAAWGLFVKGRKGQKKKNHKPKQLRDTWVFEGGTLFASPQAVILSDLKLNRARPA